MTVVAAPTRSITFATGAGASLLAALFGAASVLGFAPFYVWPVPIVTLAGFAWLIRQASSARRAAALGFAFGMGFFLTGVSWVFVSMHDFGGMPIPIAAFATAFFCAYLALFPAAVGYLTRRMIAAADAVRLALVFPAAWALSEWIRGWMFTGFPWLAVGYAQSPGGPLSAYAPLIGVYGVSLATAATAGTLAWWSPWTRVRRGWRGVLTHPAVVMLLCVWVLALGLRTVQWTTPAGAPVSVSLAQGNIKQDIKWQAESVQASLDTYLRLTLSSPGRLILLPETAIPLLDNEVPVNYFDLLAQHARDNHGDSLVGVPQVEPGNPPRYYNSVRSFGTQPGQTYRKHHLVPFGDYFPDWALISWIMSTLDIPMSSFSRGPAVQPPLQVADQRVAVNICYEDVFGEEIIRQLPQATLLANFTNDAWWGDSIASEQHLQMSQMRSQETGRYMLRATNTGVTAIIDERGQVQAKAPQFVTTILNGTAQGYIGSTPYVRWGNAVVLALACGMLAAALWRGRKA
ncbi:MAG TPA: apolipoprotein N-acyltransferase [Burkholderiales bacterium]|nr:apolipoprotein N-acyltransferase [Burkholderiales bacterium]